MATKLLDIEPVDIDRLDPEAKAKAIAILRELDRRRKTFKLKYYHPYDFQKQFLNQPASIKQKMLMAANRIGKSDIGAYEVAVHATGLYPDWWEGIRFSSSPIIVCGGQTNTTVKDIAQSKLLGDSAIPEAYGTGFLPLHLIEGRPVRKPGIPNAIESVTIKHVSGGTSKIIFQSYEAGKVAWMGVSYDFVWLDEEPPIDIYSQALRGVVDRDGYVAMTFTPENGITQVVHQFMNELGTYQYLQNATWDDAPHITPEVRQSMLEAMPPFEREMRMKGLPMMGSGLVFPVSEDDLRIPPIEVPPHWKRIGGIDFGIDHPTAWVSVAYDSDSDVIYIVDTYRRAGRLPSENASVIKQKGGNHYPCAWPHDGLVRDKTSGAKLRDLYRQEGLEMLVEKFTNPPSPGKPEGSGGNSVEFGNQWLLERMESGRFKVFATLTDWFEEFRTYHRKDGKIVPIRDDLLSATRYACLSLRFARAADHKFECYIPDSAEFCDPEVAY